MSRALPEWSSDNPDAAIPPRVKLRIIERYKTRCAECTRKLVPGQFAFDHIVALANGGKHAESNLQPLCNEPCHARKTKADVAEKSKVYAVRSRHVGVRARTSRPMAGSKASGWRKKINGEVVRR